MADRINRTYIDILRRELVVALGCTEPIAIAYAGAKVREVLGAMPESVEVFCSGSIIKNVQGVTVPNSGGLKGIPIAATLGVVGGDASRQLAVLEAVSTEDVAAASALASRGFCTYSLADSTEMLYIGVRAQRGAESAEVEIQGTHTNITKILKDGMTLYSSAATVKNLSDDPEKSALNIRDIMDFADHVELSEIRDILEHQIECNRAISMEGIKQAYGAQVGRTLLLHDSSVKTRAKAAAAAGSDARMSGCPMPVVINSGSGNQGITVTMPILEYAREYMVSEDRLLRALALGNLIAIHQKKYIGSLSAYCGAVCAACGSGAGIAYLMGADYDTICGTITNTLANVAGIVCDGAKPSCAAKIASAVEAAVMGFEMCKRDCVFKPGEGLIREDIEGTIKSVGRLGREGMKATNTEILNIMLGN